MTHDELENLIYERTRCFVDGSVADCILELIAAEREECAKVCDEVIRDLYIVDGDASEEVSRCAAAIRARGEK